MSPKPIDDQVSSRSATVGYMSHTNATSHRPWVTPVLMGLAAGTIAWLASPVLIAGASPLVNKALAAAGSSMAAAGMTGLVPGLPRVLLGGLCGAFIGSAVAVATFPGQVGIILGFMAGNFALGAVIAHYPQVAANVFGGTTAAACLMLAYNFWAPTWGLPRLGLPI